MSYRHLRSHRLTKLRSLTFRRNKEEVTKNGFLLLLLPMSCDGSADKQLLPIRNDGCGDASACRREEQRGSQRHRGRRAQGR